MSLPEQSHRALITGLSGQDGSFLAELLLEKGYQVTGMVRNGSADRLGSSHHLRDRVAVVGGDLLEAESLIGAVAGTQPDELYHLAAPSFVPEAWKDPSRTIAAIAGSTATLLQAVREHSPNTRVFLAASAAMFGSVTESPQHEETPCRPDNPYATAKLAAHQLIGQLREREGLHACSGILYNHESERRSERFVSRKISRTVAAIRLGLAHEVVLGDLEAVRDWSFVGDIMLGAWMMLQQDEPADYILASGIPHTVRELADLAFSQVGLNARDHIRVDPDLVRAAESAPLIGDPARARDRMGWRPAVGFEELVRRMVEADMVALSSSAASSRPSSRVRPPVAR